MKNHGVPSDFRLFGILKRTSYFALRLNPCDLRSLIGGSGSTLLSFEKENNSFDCAEYDNSKRMLWKYDALVRWIAYCMCFTALKQNVKSM